MGFSVSNEHLMLSLSTFSPEFLWPYLPPLTKMFIMFLSAVCIYSSYALSKILVRLHSFAIQPPGTPGPFLGLHERISNVQRLIQLTSYLFAFCFLLQIPAAFSILKDSRRSLWSILASHLTVYIAYATDVLGILVALHSAQWFVAYQVHKATRRFQNARNH